jgi:hypothetical protein
VSGETGKIHVVITPRSLTSDQRRRRR